MNTLTIKEIRKYPHLQKRQTTSVQKKSGLSLIVENEKNQCKRFEGLISIIKNVGQFIFEPIVIFGQIMWEKLKKFFAQGGAQITNAFNTAINGIIKAYNWFANSRAPRCSERRRKYVFAIICFVLGSLFERKKEPKK